MPPPGGAPPIPMSPINTVRMAASLGSPRKTAQALTSSEGAQRAAGMLWINTVIEPLTIGGCGPGTGGCIGPALVAPLQTHVQPTCAAGIISIITGAAPHIGQGPGAIGPMTPLGTVMSCVIGSPIRAAGNIVLTFDCIVQAFHRCGIHCNVNHATPRPSARLLRLQVLQAHRRKRHVEFAGREQEPRFGLRVLDQDQFDFEHHVLGDLHNRV